MKSPWTTDSWHTEAAKILCIPFEQKLDPLTWRLKLMDLLPLEDETWVPIATGPVHFAQAQGIDIPSDIDLRIISKKVANTDRLCLLKNLGVEPASVAIVRNKILERYSEQGSPTYIPLRASKHHLEFLYLTQKSRAKKSHLICDCQSLGTRRSGSTDPVQSAYSAPSRMTRTVLGSYSTKLSQDRLRETVRKVLQPSS